MRRFLKYLALFLLLAFVVCAIPEVFYKNEGRSKSIGTVGKGQLENAYLMPLWGANFSYFSPLSYYVMDNGYTDSKVHNTLLEAYETCETSCKGTHFKIMECSDKKGGKLRLHRTHQNGMSVDFMSPKKRQNGKQSRFFDRLGLWHYLLEFTNAGNLTIASKVSIDFETMAKHILALDDAARKNGLRINKVILKIELKPAFFRTESGKKVKARGIYFARSLPDLVNRMHDDHYHIDFERR